MGFGFFIFIKSMFRTNPYFICIKIVAKMGGIEAAEEMTPEQLDALSGGELLRQEASSFTQVLGSILQLRR